MSNLLKRDASSEPTDPLPDRAVLVRGEQPFWGSAGARWRQLAGDFATLGFSFEWHEWHAASPLQWSESFHPDSVEICLNIEGTGWVACQNQKLEFVSGTAGFYTLSSGSIGGQRASGHRHQFLSIEYSTEFLRRRLEAHEEDLHPLIRRCLAQNRAPTGVSELSPLNHRRQEMLKSLLHPPVLKAAQRLWYESKALEFAAEFFFSGQWPELLCTRAQQMARERVHKAKQILLENLAEPPSLEDLGKQVACSHFYLSRTFTQETGLTISQWLRRARLERAAELLRSGQCNVTEAAVEVGYSSLSHFSQAFHEVFGCCPGLYPLKTSAQRTNSRP